jgi:hypothetical protein
LKTITAQEEIALRDAERAERLAADRGWRGCHR